ncbi:MAG TPA: hypothetical protein DEQ73_03840, partial [Phycisphaerales bacterium]|nr:hypothetical protein [Phycisphaerales bacterium]
WILVLDDVRTSGRCFTVCRGYTFDFVSVLWIALHKMRFIGRAIPSEVNDKCTLMCDKMSHIDGTS